MDRARLSTDTWSHRRLQSRNRLRSTETLAIEPNVIEQVYPFDVRSLVGSGRVVGCLFFRLIGRSSFLAFFLLGNFSRRSVTDIYNIGQTIKFSFDSYRWFLRLRFIGSGWIECLLQQAFQHHSSTGHQILQTETKCSTTGFIRARTCLSCEQARSSAHTIKVTGGPRSLLSSFSRISCRTSETSFSLGFSSSFAGSSVSLDD